MQKPQAIEYQTPHKNVILSDPKQLVVKQGFKCISAGTVKVKGKFSPLFVRYDNKPELAAKIAEWVNGWEEYNKWYKDQVSLAMETMKISGGNLNFDKAENADFTWTYWDGTSGKTLTEKATGREIYQMKYTGGGGSVEGETRVKAMAFWDALEELKDAPKPSLTLQEIDSFERTVEQLHSRNDHPGWCNHCHSYCYGDCQS